MNMNIDIKDVLAWLKTLTTPYPARDWLVVVALASTVAVLMAAGAGYLYIGIKSGALIQAGITDRKPPEPVARAEMQRVLEVYGIRFANYEASNFPSADLFDPHLVLKK